jgi:hypothetical protein
MQLILETYFQNLRKITKKMKKNRLESFACECVYMFPRMRYCLLAFGLVRMNKMHSTKLQFLALKKKHQQYSDRQQGKSYEIASSTVARGICMQFHTGTAVNLKKIKILDSPCTHVNGHIAF